MARLIDADELVRIVELIDERYDLSGLRGIYPRRVLTRDSLIFLINRLPTLDTVKHGKWGETYYHYGEGDFVRDCSECGEPYSPPTRYCPNCGARMDGE